ncbi:MAG TPA: alkaline phosphatase family protein [Pedomonas sp.]|uniref:alkaline phosphatase family protein n=1 Tax=Pedomonas sp. TaxID=2976421 RepID=UPI002F414BD2
MSMRGFRHFLLAASSAVALAAPALAAGQSAPAPATSARQEAAGAVTRSAVQPRPKLVIAISVDQFSGNLFEAWRGRFTGGLKRLGNQGITYANGYQTHGATETCPGHSTLLTGRHPSNTGIIANGWYDIASGRDVYCMEDTAMRPAHDVQADASEGRSARNLRVSTVGDWLKAQSPKSRVVAVSGKDRGALNMGGHKADASFWFASGYGFTTSVPAGQSGDAALKPLADFNRSLQASWQASPPMWTYADEQCSALEDYWQFGEKTWRSQVPPVSWQTGSREDVLKSQYAVSPLLDAATLDAARVLIEHYKLGQGEATDLLAVSLSATDLVGHRYGTAGPEMCDQMVRLDRELGAFLDDLEKLGVPVMVVVSADHGGIDFPERLAKQGYPTAGRLAPRPWLEEVNARLRQQLRLDWNPLTTTDDGTDINQIYVVDRAGKRPAAAVRERGLKAAVPLINGRTDVAAAYSLETLLETKVDRAKPVDELTLQERFALSTDKERSGDITVAFGPYQQYKVPRPDRTLTGHGTVWNYDRRVPILFWWPGITPQERPLPVPTVDIAPTLAHVLGIQPDPTLDGQCRDLADFGNGACPAPKW